MIKRPKKRVRTHRVDVSKTISLDEEDIVALNLNKMKKVQAKGMN